MQAWIDHLKTCENEESFKTTYQSFLDTTWQALQGVQQCTGDFPYVQPTTEEITRAYYMKNRTLILHNQIVWGEGADDDRPMIPTQGEPPQQESSRRGTSRSARKRKDRSGDHGDSDDPHDPGSSANPPSRGDEAHDKVRKRMRKKPRLRLANRNNLRKLKSNGLQGKPRKRYKTWSDN